MTVESSAYEAAVSAVPAAASTMAPHGMTRDGADQDVDSRTHRDAGAVQHQ